MDEMDGLLFECFSALNVMDGWDTRCKLCHERERKGVEMGWSGFGLRLTSRRFMDGLRLSEKHLNVQCESFDVNGTRAVWVFDWSFSGKIEAFH